MSIATTVIELPRSTFKPTRAGTLMPMRLVSVHTAKERNMDPLFQNSMRQLGYEVRPDLKNPNRYRWWKITADGDGASVPPLDCSSETFDSEDAAWMGCALREGLHRQLNSLETYAHAGTLAGKATRRGDESCRAFHADWVRRATELESPTYRLLAKNAYEEAYRREATPPIANF